MDQVAVLSKLRASEQSLRKLGVARLSLFGSTARGRQRTDSDVDLAASLDPKARVGLFRYAVIVDRLSRLVGTPIDLVTEPNPSARLQAQIDRDRVVIF